MVRGLYAAAAGMMSFQEQTATTANNLANADTAGFKADLLLFTSAPSIHTWRVGGPEQARTGGQPAPQYIGLTNAGTADTEIWRDYSQGQLTATRQPLDVAIIGEGFFRVSDGTAEYYSRDGQFRQAADGLLVDNCGRRVQGLAGDINLGSSNDIYINASGEVFADGALLDRLNLAFFTTPEEQLSKAGDNLWRASSAPDGVGVTEVRSGFIERSNVDVFRCMSELIIQQRNYEAAQKVIQTEDAELDMAANQVGRMPQ